ncbi:hypothetical protein CERZMDRAFT_8286, partial [Cercospora zeae-maydis SCOH1-5]
YGETLQIKFGRGRNAKTFTVHKEVLTFYSGYFEAAFRDGTVFREAKTGVSPIFEQFVHWIYSRRIDCGSDAEPFHILCRLWVLADRREVPLLMNECINTMRDKSSELWMAPAICLPYIYKNTMPGSAMRRLLIQLIARTSTSLLLERIDMDFSKEMLVDML